MLRSSFSRVAVRLNSTTATPYVLHENVSRILPKLSEITSNQLHTPGSAHDTYYLPRTSKGNLPIYKTIKSQAVYTEITKIQGSVTQCRNDLQAFLPETSKKDYSCNMTTKSILIKGDYASRLKNALEAVL